MSKDYVPRSRSALYVWQENIDVMVTANAVAWNVPATVVTELNTKASEFQVLSNAVKKKETRTPQQVAAYYHYRDSYVKFLRQLVQGYLVNNPDVPYDDKIAMGLNVRSGSRSARPAITTTPIVAFKSLAGGFMRFDCENAADGRSAIPNNADGVELHINVEVETEQANEDGEVVTVTETKALLLQSSKARYTYEFGLDLRGSKFTVSARYYNNSDRAKDGPFGSTVVGFIG